MRPPTREENVKKSELAGCVAAKLSLPKTTADASVAAVFEVIGDALAKEDPVSMAGFGIFSVKDRVARQGRTPRTGGRRDSGLKVASFKAGKGLREAMR